MTKTYHVYNDETLIFVGRDYEEALRYVDAWKHQQPNDKLTVVDSLTVFLKNYQDAKGHPLPTLAQVEKRMKLAKECLRKKLYTKADGYISSAWHSLMQLRDVISENLDDVDRSLSDVENCGEDDFYSPGYLASRGYSATDEIRKYLITRKEFLEKYNQIQ